MRSQYSLRFVSQLTKDTLALVMAGGRGARLGGLTDWRAKPAVPFGGQFRIIDFTLSNCINSGIKKVGVLTQYKAHSLILHVQRAWGHLRGEFGEFVELIPAQQRVASGWYTGTADSIFQNIDIIRSHGPRYVLVLAGDHIYKMDYGTMLAQHIEKYADVTVGCIAVPRERAHAYGVMEVDESGRIRTFSEKPTHPAPMPGDPGMALCSMGIYVFNTDFLCEELIRDRGEAGSAHDFGENIIPDSIDKYHVLAFPFQDSNSGGHGYWRDVGTLDAFWGANLELAGVTPELNLYDDEWPIWTYQQQLPPAKFVFNEDGRRGMAVDSMVSAGCVVSGAKVERSLLAPNVRVDDCSQLDGAVVLPEVRIGKYCRIRNAILDKGCEIPDGTVIGEKHAEDRQRFHVSSGGVVLVTPDMLGQKLHRPY